MSKPKLIAIDIETTGLNPRQDVIHGLGVAWTESEGRYIQAAELDGNENLRNYLADPDKHIVGHNVRFDLKFLIVRGFEINCRVWDTKVLAQLVDENQELGLKALTAKYLGDGNLTEKNELDRAVSKAGLKHVGDLCRADLTTPTTEYADLIARYCIEDCVNTLKLWGLLAKAAKAIADNMGKFGFKNSVLDYYLDEAMPIERVLMEMEMRGIEINVEALKDYRATLAIENDQYIKKIDQLVSPQVITVENRLLDIARSKKKSEKGKANVLPASEKHKTKFNWQSGDHIAMLLSQGFGITAADMETTNTGKLSTSESSLETLRQDLDDGGTLAQFLTVYAKWKKNLKLLNTYTGGNRGLLSQVEGQRVYAEYLQSGRGKEGTKGGTVTGRLSSRSPNMQNLPRDSVIKSFFIAGEGKVFIYFDYSQLELRLAAHLSQDKVLLEAYREGRDLHQITGDYLGVGRQIGKTTNFAMIYDASPWRLSTILDNSVDESKQIIDDFYGLYAGYAEYLRKQKAFMSKYGLVVAETGRVRRLPDLVREHPRSKEWKHALKQGYNFPIQSLGASITKRAMVALANAGYKLITQVHDSVVIEAKESEAPQVVENVKQIAENIYPLTVALKADIKLLTSLSESDIVNKGGINESEYSKNRQYQVGGGLHESSRGGSESYRPGHDPVRSVASSEARIECAAGNNVPK